MYELRQSNKSHFNATAAAATKRWWRRIKGKRFTHAANWFCKCSFLNCFEISILFVSLIERWRTKSSMSWIVSVIDFCVLSSNEYWYFINDSVKLLPGTVLWNTKHHLLSRIKSKKIREKKEELKAILIIISELIKSH